MKKYLALTMAACMALSLAACGSSASSTTSSSAAASTEATSDSAATAEATGSANITGIAQCCDVGTLDDESFNQGCWEAVKSYGDESGIEYNYYLPSGEDASDEDRETLIRQAVADGANTIVCVGYLYGPALAWAATEYPDVHFIAVDVNGFDINSEDGTIPENVFCVTFKEEEAGYLAGYAAVKDGFTKLGFLGGTAVPAVIRYGYGFVQGANEAAAEMGINDVNIKYWYSGGFAATDEVKNKMDGWYSEGTEVVFACGGPVCQSCDAAAQANGGKMIGVDVDQSGQFDTVVTSAMKGLAESVNEALTDALNNGWKFSETYSGKETKLGAAENCVGLPMSTSKFTKFTQEQYDSMYASIVDGTLAIDDSYDADVKPAVTTITVDYQS